MKSPLLDTINCWCVAYYIDGWSYKAIADLYEYSPKTVSKYVKMFGPTVCDL